MFKAIVPNPNDEGVILIRGVPFGSAQERDVHSQYFTQNTNFLSHILPLPPLFHFHGAKSGSLADQIGETLGREQRSDGIWYRAKLYLNSTKEAVKTKANQLWEAAKAGKLYASSGAVEATIKISDTGEILQWLVGELSLVNGDSPRERPASFHATVIPVKTADHHIETGDVVLGDLDLKNIKSDYTEPKSDTRSNEMPDENPLLTQLQQQVAELTKQLAVIPQLQGQVTDLTGQLQTREATIAELQTVVSTKSAEVAMGGHVGLVDNWIKEGKVTPAERDHVLEVLSFAYQADTSTKGDVGFVNSIKGWIDARPTNPVIGNPAAVYSNVSTLNGGAVQGPGGGVDPANVARLKRYAEIAE